MVMGRELGHDPAQMPLVDRHYIIQALPPEGPHQPFTEGVRLRRPVGRLENPNTEALQRQIDLGRKDAIAVMDQES